jgi:hypothetical protein
MSSAAGIDAAGSPAPAWRQARTALRFTTPRGPVVAYDDLSALALLAELPQDALHANVDVPAIAQLATEFVDLDTMDAHCATGSLRRAAHLLHLHHNSVARGLEHLGKALGIDLTLPIGLMRAGLALTARWLLKDRCTTSGTARFDSAGPAAAPRNPSERAPSCSPGNARPFRRR